MNARNIYRNKTLIFAVIVAALLVIGVAGWQWQKHRSNSHYVAKKCSAYGPSYDYFNGPDSIQEMANDSVAIAIATAEDPDVLRKSLFTDSPKPMVRITNVLKGSAHTNVILPICAGMGYIDLQETKHPAVLLFLEGKDGDTWIPTWGSTGIAPQNKDGSFTAENVRKKPITMDELRGIIR